MEIKATMKPGQNAIKRYMEKYGDRLLCVRYGDTDLFQHYGLYVI